MSRLDDPCDSCGATDQGIAVHLCVHCFKRAVICVRMEKYSHTINYSFDISTYYSKVNGIIPPRNWKDLMTAK